MQKPFAPATYRLIVGIVALGTVIAQMVNGFSHPPFDYPNYFSFFSIHVNLFAGLLMTVSAVLLFRGGRGNHLTYWRGAATLYLTLAGTVYFILLRGADETLQTPQELTNAALHYLVPSASLADWWFAPKERIPFRLGLTWLLYPLFYVLYSLLRGRFTDWYPYGFLNPHESGYGGVVTVCLVLAALMTGCIALMTWSTSCRNLTPPLPLRVGPGAGG